MALLTNLATTLRSGQLLMVETQCEMLIGTLKHYDDNCKIIELDNVRDFKTNYMYTSAQMLPLPQIKSVRKIEDDDSLETESTSKSDHDSTACSTISSIASASPPKPPSQRTCGEPISSNSRSSTYSSINLNSRELLLIQEQLNNFTYIYQTDQHYHKALADIKSQSIVGVLLDPMEYGRHSKTSLLAISTPRAVYIFDIQTLGKIFREFREILESKRPRKILHYSHRIVDNLLHRQGVKLSGIFDTFVAHCLISGTKTHMNLVETVQHYFNISECYFEEIGTMEPLDPLKRPIAKAHLQLLAKLSIFQYKLYEHLLHEQMLANFYKQCEQFSNTFSSNQDTVEVVMQMKPHSRQGFENIEPHVGWNKLLDKLI